MRSRISQRVRSQLKSATLMRFGQASAGAAVIQNAAVDFRLPDEYLIVGWTWAVNLSFPFDADGFCYWEFSLDGSYHDIVNLVTADDNGGEGALGGVLDTMVIEHNYESTAAGKQAQVLSDTKSIILPPDVRPKLFEGDHLYINVHKNIPASAAEFVKLTVLLKEW